MFCGIIIEVALRGYFICSMYDLTPVAFSSRGSSSWRDCCLTYILCEVSVIYAWLVKSFDMICVLKYDVLYK